MILSQLWRSQRRGSRQCWQPLVRGPGRGRRDGPGQVPARPHHGGQGRQQLQVSHDDGDDDDDDDCDDDDDDDDVDNANPSPGL